MIYIYRYPFAFLSFRSKIPCGLGPMLLFLYPFSMCNSVNRSVSFRSTLCVLRPGRDIYIYLCMIYVLYIYPFALVSFRSNLYIPCVLISVLI